MALRIATRQSGDVTILDLDGRVTIGADNDVFNNCLQELVRRGLRKVLVNLTGLHQMDSSGLSSLVHAFVTLQRAGGSLKLLHPTGHVREVLEVTRLNHSIPTLDDEAQAVASFGSSAKPATQ